ncbi:MAG: IS3 family transposase [Desulfobacterales bacterium]|nr:MAG: IS3 family transposase [Desulfobacterales bacterium]
MFGFIDEHRTLWSVEEMCRVLSVSRSGYYRWRNRPESQRAIENRCLDAHIKAIFNRHKGRCGSPKITDELNDMGFPVSKNRVARRMKAIGLRSIYRRKYRTTTDSKHSHPVAGNLLQRNFTTDGPDKVWVSDITYIATARGWMYLTVFIDLFSRMVVVWARSSSLSAEMVLTALGRGIRNRRPGSGLIIHSDRGVQYACKDFRKVLKKHGFVQSMSRKGDCWERGVCPWGTMQWPSHFSASSNRN